MEMDVIPPRPHVNVYQAYDWMIKIRNLADILIPLHRSCLAGMDVTS
ncbi:MAG: hypothetical protein WA151_05370 [Desulfatirhabdiaceae bacterium]